MLRSDAMKVAVIEGRAAAALSRLSVVGVVTGVSAGATATVTLPYIAGSVLASVGLAVYVAAAAA